MKEAMHGLMLMSAMSTCYSFVPTSINKGATFSTLGYGGYDQQLLQARSQMRAFARRGLLYRVTDLKGQAVSAIPSVSVPSSATEISSSAAAQAAAVIPAAATSTPPASSDILSQVDWSVIKCQGVLSEFRPQIFGGDAPVLTAFASLSLILTLAVTLGAAYLTYESWKDDQFVKKFQDPSSEEYKEMVRTMQELEVERQGSKSARGKALREATEITDDAPSKPPERILAEPGNRDERRMKAKRRKEEETKAAAAKRKAELVLARKGKAGSGDYSSIAADEKRESSSGGGLGQIFGNLFK